MKTINLLFIIAATAVTTHIVTDCTADNVNSRVLKSSTERTELDGDLDYVEKYSRNKTVRTVVDRWTQEVVLKDLSWLSYNEGDSLVAFAQKNRRGYLNLRSRKPVLLDEKIVKAYIYKEGRAMTESFDSLYILDTQQKTIARFHKTGERDTEVNTFHKGHLPMIGENGKLGLIDTCGVWEVEPQYDKILWALDEFWLGISNPVMMDEATGKELPPHRIVMDSKLRTVMEGNWSYLMVTKDGYITVADQNHWQWHYALDGTMIDDFVCKEVQQMDYPTGEKKWFKEKDEDSGITTMKQVDVSENSSLMKYVTAEGWEGLMTKEGKVVTPPVFCSISAVNKNLYLCKYDTSEDYGILVNEKGERIEHKR